MTIGNVVLDSLYVLAGTARLDHHMFPSCKIARKYGAIDRVINMDFSIEETQPSQPLQQYVWSTDGCNGLQYLTVLDVVKQRTAILDTDNRRIHTADRVVHFEGIFNAFSFFWHQGVIYCGTSLTVQYRVDWHFKIFCTWSNTNIYY